MKRIRLISLILIMSMLLSIIFPIQMKVKAKEYSNDVKLSLVADTSEIKKGINTDNYIEVTLSVQLNNGAGLDKLYGTLFYDSDCLEYVSVEKDNNFNGGTDNTYAGEIECSYERDKKYGLTAGVIAKFKFKVIKDADTSTIRFGNINEDGTIDDNGVEIEAAYNGTYIDCEPQLLKFEKAKAAQSTLTVNPGEGSWSDGNNTYSANQTATFTEDSGTTKNIPNPTGTQSNITIRFNLNGGDSADSIQATSAKEFTEWTGTGKEKLSGTTYTFDETDRELTAQYKYKQITYPSATRNGYNFKGWYTAATGGTLVAGGNELADPPTTTGLNVVNLYAQWEGKDTKVTVNPNGGKWTHNGTTYTNSQAITGKVGEEITIEDPIKTGKKVTFDGNGGTSSKSSDTTQVTFGSWDSSLSTSGLSGTTYTFQINEETLTANYNESNITLPTATWDNHTFKGWYTTPTGGTLVGQAGEKYQPQQDITIFAQWINKSNLIVDPNGGTWRSSTSQTTIGPKDEGTTEQNIEDPTISTKGPKVSFNYKEGSGTIQYLEESKEFDKWVLTGGGSFSGTTFTYGATDGTLKATYKNKSITLPDAQRQGYDTTGWFYSNGTKAGNVGDTIVVDSDVTLEAHYQLDTSTKYTLTEDLNGGNINGNTNNPTKRGASGTTIPLDSPTKDGYVVSFDGNGQTISQNSITQIQTTKEWQLQTNNGGTVSGMTFKFGTGDDTVFAVYEGQAITLPAQADLAMYHFLGWTETPNGTVITGGKYTPLQNTTLYAKWQKKIELDIDTDGGNYGGTTSPNPIYDVTGNTVTLQSPTKDGYVVSFDGNGQTISQQDIKQTRTFKEWTVDGGNSSTNGTISGLNFTFGTKDPEKVKATYNNSPITLPAKTDLTDYKFIGWSETKTGETILNAGNEYIPQSNVTLYAQWERILKVTLDTKGGTYTGDNPARGMADEKITLSRAGDIDGYTVHFKDNNDKFEITIPDVKQKQEFVAWKLVDGFTGKVDSNGLDFTFAKDDSKVEATFDRKEIVLPTPEDVTGYKFLGWYKEKECTTLVGNANDKYMPTIEDETLYAKWERIRVETTLTVDSKGEKWTDPEGNSHTTDQYTRKGKEEDQVEIKDPENRTITIKYDGNNGTTTKSSDQVVKQFINWDITNDQQAGKFDTATKIFTYGMKDTTLTAEYETPSITLPDATREDYVFIGWGTIKDDRSSIVGLANENYTSDKDITLYAEWKKISKLVVDPNGEEWNTFTTSQTYEQKEGTTLQIPNPVVKTQPETIKFDVNGGKETLNDEKLEKVFDKWEENGANNLSGSTYTFGSETDHILKAKYKVNPIKLPNATRDGYILLGWYTEKGKEDLIQGVLSISKYKYASLNPMIVATSQDEEGIKVGMPGDLFPGSNYTFTPGKEVTLYAHWEKEKIYTLKIDPNGGTYKGSKDIQEEQGKNGSTISLEIPVAPQGYTVLLEDGTKIIQTQSFDHWEKEEKTEGTVTNTSFTFGKSDSKIKAIYKGDAVKLPTKAPEKKGYILDSWIDEKGEKVGNPGDSFIPTKDNQRIYPHYVKEELVSSIIYKDTKGVNNVNNPSTYVQGSKNITLVNLPNTSEYKFLGWYDANGNKVTTIDTRNGGNIELYAHWEKNITQPNTNTTTNVIASKMDNTTAKKVLPKTGVEKTGIIIFISGILIIAFEYIRYKKYSDIK